MRLLKLRNSIIDYAWNACSIMMWTAALLHSVISSQGCRRQKQITVEQKVAQDIFYLSKYYGFTCYGALGTFQIWYLYTCSKNDVNSSVRKHYCALGLGLGLGLKLRLRLELRLGISGDA